ncbi:MAG TPA: low molecular weight protein-tyrosine-phosphatase [Marmoricola sp.]
MYRVAVVCLGNICRSPIADVVLNAELDEAGLADRVEVTSCGTGTWHVGEPMDSRAAAVLTSAGYDASRHRARHFGVDWHDHDLILVMDHDNLADVLAELPADRHDRVRLFRSYDPEVRATDPVEVPAVPDPFYGGPDGFDDVLAIVERTARRVVEELALVR